MSDDAGRNPEPPRPGLAGAPNRHTSRVGVSGRALIALVRLYQLTLSPYLGRHCRFVPTCSQYFIDAVRRHGALVGSLRGLWRILRCHPFAKGGYDPAD